MLKKFFAVMDSPRSYVCLACFWLAAAVNEVVRADSEMLWVFVDVFMMALGLAIALIMWRTRNRPEGEKSWD